jgi:hypothetical protein
MEENRIHFLVPYGWGVRQAEPDGELVMIAPGNPSSTPFRPNVVIVGSRLDGRSIEEILDGAFAALEAAIGPINRAAVVSATEDAPYLRADYQYQQDGVDISALQFVVVDGERSITTTCTCATADLGATTDVFEEIASSVRFDAVPPEAAGVLGAGGG